MAMNMDAALTLRAKVEGANSIIDFNRSLTGVETTAKNVTGALKTMAGASGGLSGALSALTPLLSVAGLVGMAKGALDAGQEMLHMSEKTGVSVEQLAKFKKAAALTNTDLETVGKSIVKLDKSMVDAFANGKSSKWFDALGISVKDSSGKLRDSNAVMLDIANRFHEMPDGAAKTAIALGLFGRAGAEMIPMLDMGGDAISKLQTKMTSAFAEKADEYKKKLAALSGQVQILGMDLAEALLPALEKITTAVTSGVEAFNKLPGPVKDLAIGGALVAIAWGPITGIFSGAVGLFGAAAGGMELLAYQTALAGGVMPLLAGGIEGVGVAIASVPIVGWIAGAATALGLLGVALYNNNQDFHNWATNVAAVVSGDFKNAMKEIGDTAQLAFGIVKKAMNDTKYQGQQVAYGLQEMFGGAFAQIAIQAKKYFGQVLETIQSLWNKIPANIRAGMGQAAQNVLNTIPAGYAASVYFRAFTQGAPTKTNTKTNDEKTETYNPDLPGGGGGGRGANLGKLDTAGINEANALAKENSTLETQIKREAVQEKLNALALLETQYRDAGNVNAELSTKLQAVQLQYAEDRNKVESDLQAALKDNADATNQTNRAEKDRKENLKATLELKKLEINYEKNVADIAFQTAKAEHDRQLAQRNALEDIANRNRYAVLGATQGSLVQQQTQQLDALERKMEEIQSKPGLFNPQTIRDLDQQYQALKASFAEMQALGNNVSYGAAKGAQEYLNGIGTLADSIGGAVKGTLTQLEDGLINFVETGKVNFRAFADYAVKELARIAIEQAIVGPIAKAFGGLFGGGSGGNLLGYGGGSAFSFANGGIMTAAGSMPLRTYAGGGVANSPQMAIFGEGSTPEAYVPLPDGRRIPVAMKNGGGSGSVINVAVDAKGTTVSGNGGQSAQLGRVIAAAVQNELINQRRPGGLLAA